MGLSDGGGVLLVGDDGAGGVDEVGEVAEEVVERRVGDVIEFDGNGGRDFGMGGVAEDPKLNTELFFNCWQYK